jgi:hypothetical protein
MTLSGYELLSDFSYGLGPKHEIVSDIVLS